jgi:hypothetical protein
MQARVTSDLGRYVFGLAAACLGLIGFFSRDFAPWGPAFVYAASAAQVVGGLAVLWRRSVAIGAIVLLVVYILFSVQLLPDIFVHPAVFGSWGNFFLQFSLVAGVLILCAAVIRESAATRVLQEVGYFGFGICLVSFALYQAFYLKYTASLVPLWIPLSQMFWTIATTIAFGLAAIALLTGFMALTAARLTTLMLVLFGILVWVPAIVVAPKTLFNWSEAVETFVIAGVSWIVADYLARRASARAASS